MWQLLRLWLNDLPVRDLLARRQAHIVQTALLAVAAVALAALGVALRDQEGAAAASAAAPHLVSALFAVGGLILLRRGSFRAAVLAGVSGLLLALALLVIEQGARRAPGAMLGFALPIVLAGMLIDRRWLLATFAACCAIVLAGAPEDAAAFALIAGIFTLLIDRGGAMFREALIAQDEASEGLRRELAGRAQLEEELRRQSSYLAELHETSLELMSRRDLDDLLQTVVKRAARLLGTEHGFLYRADDESGLLIPTVSIGLFTGSAIYLQPLRAGEGLSGRVWASGAPLAIDDYDSWPGRTPAFPRGEFRAIAGAPLTTASRVIGVIGLAYTEPGRLFGDEEIRLLGGFAQLAALALDNASLHQEAQEKLEARAQTLAALRDSEESLRRQHSYLSVLHETTLALMRRMDLDDLLEAIVRHSARLLDASNGFLYMAEPETETLVTRVAIGPLSSRTGSRQSRSEGMAGRCWATGELQVSDDYDTWPGRMPDIPLGAVRAIACAPLTIGAEVVGVIGVSRSTPGRTFSAEEVQLLRALAQLAAIALDNAQLYEAVQRELTAHTQSLAALRDSEERYRLIAQNSSDLIGLLDKTGRYIYASPSFSTVLGLSTVSLIGEHITSLVHPDDQALVLTPGAQQSTFRCRHTDGGWRWIEVSWNRIAQGGALYVIFVGRDVTERKALEAQLLQAQKLESIGRLAGGMAHDFNNLLTAISGYAEFARDSLAPETAVYDDVSQIIQAAARASDLTRQLLMFARRQSIEPVIVDLNHRIREMEGLLRQLLGVDIELLTRPAPDLWPIRVDPGQIEQVILNLAVNARDAMPAGGRLTIETCNVPLDQSYAVDRLALIPGDYVLLSVSDTGTGIEESILEHIFEPFFTTKEPGRGTGLGLATCYGIVTQHGGLIWPRSTPGSGSTFHVYLPRASAPLSDQPPDGRDAIPRGSELVLVSEDDPSVRQMVARALRDQGYDVIESASGDETLALAQRRPELPVRLLVTDMVMPRLGGLALAERIQPIYPGIKILLISGHADGAVRPHGVPGLHTAFLQKPFSPAALARAVREALDS